jgi:hypothetical protein
MSSLKRRLLVFAAVKLTAVKFWQAGNRTRVYFNFTNRNYTGYIEPANTGEAGGWTMRYPPINQGGEVTRDAMQAWLSEKFGHSHKPKFVDIWLQAGGPPLNKSEPIIPKTVPAPIKKIVKPAPAAPPVKFAPPVPNRKLTDAQYREELAKLLQTSVKNLPNRMGGMKLGITCPRCGGSGHYSYNQISGTTCFQCGGAGIILPKQPAQWEAVIDEAKKEIKAGKLHDYLSYLTARKLTKNAWDQVFKAWTATEVAKLYSAHRTTSREETEAFLKTPLYLANKRMSDVVNNIQKMSDAAQYEKDTAKRQAAVLALEPAIHIGITEIADAQKWYTAETKKSRSRK